MTSLLGKGFGLGLHKYNPSKYPNAVFLDVSDAQYNPIDPEEIIAGIHSARKPGFYGIAKFRNGSLVAEAITSYKWGGYELYIDAENEHLYVTTGENIIEVRDLNNLRLLKRLELPVKGIIGVALDSEDRLWFITNSLYGGDNGLYMINDINDPGSLRKIKQYSMPASIDSLRVSPWGQKILIADYGRHVIECINEDGELLGILYFPYVSGIKWTVDERVVISSGKFPKHVFLILITGALHNTMRSGWFGYIMDYGVQASNRADAFYIDKVLIQWYLGFFELQLPLPKHAPYLIRIGNGKYREMELIKEPGFTTFTPILVLNECIIISKPVNVELILEMMTPYYSIIAPEPNLSWEKVCTFNGKYRIDVPGIYRIRARTDTPIDVYAVCKP
ncbi:MAG: hypothetical protein DRO40_00430 [Thermoprotei archaeon]|nr:MAG: hypothetical protein DRO40_00430 [Thermoprotei archaeon]